MLNSYLLRSPRLSYFIKFSDYFFLRLFLFTIFATLFIKTTLSYKLLVLPFLLKLEYLEVKSQVSTFLKFTLPN